MHDAKASVIVPVYNGEKYINNCLKRLLMQTYDNIEIIVVDDGSADTTNEVIQRYIAQYPNIVLLSQSNQGVSAARNLALAQITGKYVTFVDCDDEVDYKYIENMVIQMEHREVQLAVCGYQTKIQGHATIEEKSNFTNEELSAQDVILRSLLHKDILPVVWNKMFLTSVIKANHIRFDDSIIIGEDMLFLVQYCLRAVSAVVVSEHLYTYILNPYGVMQEHNQRGAFRESWLSEWSAILKIERLLKENDIYSHELRVKKVRVADKLLCTMKKYQYSNVSMEHEMLKCIRENILYVFKEQDYTIKKKISIYLNALSPSLCAGIKRKLECSK